MNEPESFMSNRILLTSLLCFSVAVPATAQNKAPAATAKDKAPTPAAKPAPPQEKREADKPSFSHDGNRVVYLDRVTVGEELTPVRRELWIVNTDGDDARPLSPEADDDQPRFSPYGDSIVFTRGRDLWLVKKNGDGLRNVTNTRDAEESGAEFTSDGRSLVFLRHAPAPMSAEMQAALAKSPELAAFVGARKEQSVVLRDIATGTERTLLGDGYQVTQIVPHDKDEDVVFILCKPLDTESKPIKETTFEKVVATLKLDGTLPKVELKLKPGGKYRLKQIRPTRTGDFVEASTIIFRSDVARLKDNEIEVLPDAPSWGDASRDGKTLVGTHIVDRKMNFGLVLYDIATAKIKPLRAPEQIPELAEKHFDEGLTHAMYERHDQAIADFSAAIALHPQYVQAYKERSWSHYMKRDGKGALTDLADAIALDPNYADAYEARGDLYVLANLLPAALGEFSTAIRLDPKNDSPLEKRAKIYVRQKQVNLALADYNEAIKLNPSNLTAIFARAEIKTSRRDIAGAIADYTLALKHYPNSATVYAARAKLYRASGKAALAAADEAKARALAPKRK